MMRIYIYFFIFVVTFSLLRPIPVLSIDIGYGAETNKHDYYLAITQDGKLEYYSENSSSNPHTLYFSGWQEFKFYYVVPKIQDKGILFSRICRNTSINDAIYLYNNRGPNGHVWTLTGTRECQDIDYELVFEFNGKGCRKNNRNSIGSWLDIVDKKVTTLLASSVITKTQKRISPCNELFISVKNTGGKSWYVPLKAKTPADTGAKDGEVMTMVFSFNKYPPMQGNAVMEYHFKVHYRQESDLCNTSTTY
jgi:hypothetical protein